MHKSTGTTVSRPKHLKSTHTSVPKNSFRKAPQRKGKR